MSNIDNDEQDIPSLRRAAKDGKAALSENAELKRQLMFVKAGIDTDSRIGAMLYKTWEGDDLESLKAEGQELGLFQAATRQQATREASGQADFRDAISAGRAPDAYETPTPDPMDTALREFQSELKKGSTRENAQLAAIDRILVAGVNKDERVIYNPRKYA